MKKSFLRKVGYGLSVNEKVPDNPLDWAVAQISTIPDLNWKGPIYSLKRMMNYHADYNYTDRRILREKFKNSRKEYNRAKQVLKYKTGHYYFESLWMCIR